MPKGWKDIQSRVKRNRKTKLALGILTLVAVLLVISWTIQLTQNLFSPLESSFKEHRSYIWDGQFNINLIVRNPHISLLSYNPKEAKVIILNIPDELFLDVPPKFGKWQLRSVYDLGQSQKGMGGDRLLEETLTDFLAVPIDGFLDFSSLQPQRSAAEIVGELRKNPLSGFNLLSFLKTDLTPWELLRLKISLSNVRFDKVKEYSFMELGLLDKETLPDGTEVVSGDPIKLDSILSDLADPTVSSEHKTIAVFNATDTPQLALKWTRLITNLGGNVIITANAKEKLKKTAVTGQKSLTLEKLQQIFGYDTISPSNEDMAFSRAQINVFLGEDL